MRTGRPCRGVSPSGWTLPIKTINSFIDFVGTERYFIAPAFNWQIDENTTLIFRGEYSDDNHSTATALPYENGQVIPNIPYNRYLGEPDFTNIESETWRGLLTLEHRWNEDQKTTLSLNGAQNEAEGGNFIFFPFVGTVQDPVTGDITRDAEDIHYTNDYFTARIDHLWDWTIYDGGSCRDAHRRKTPRTARRLLATATSRR